MNRGRQPEGQGYGPGGDCVCPNCGYTTPHQVGSPCYNVKCPTCKTGLIRKV